MAVASDLFLPLLGSLAFYVLLRIATFLYRDFTAPLRVRDLPGPKSPSIWYGSFNELAVRASPLPSRLTD
jgi:hypothetical protein